MTEVSELLAAAREAYRRRQWIEARAGFAAAREAADLGADDLDALGTSAWWIGAIDECTAAWEAAYRAYVADGRPDAAAATALGIGYNGFLRGDEASGMGWLGRAQRLLADLPESMALGGLLHTTQVEAVLDSPDPDGVIASARQVQEMGQRLGEPALVASGLQGEGRVLIKNGRVAEGLALLDEAMVSVLADELPPEIAGNIYCNVIAACHELADYRRMRRWTEATERWLETMPVAVVFAGICRVHRAQLHQLTGDWDRSEREAAQVCADLADIADRDRRRGPLPGRRDPPAARRAGRGRGRLPTGAPARPRPAARAGAAAAGAGTRRGGADVHPVRARSPSPATGSPAPGSSRPRWTSRWPPTTPRRPARAPRSWTRPPTTSPAPDCGPPPSRPAAPSCSPRATSLRRCRCWSVACRGWQEIGAPYECARIRLLLATAYQRARRRRLGRAGAVRGGGGVRPARCRRPMRRPSPRCVAPAPRPGGLTDREVEVLACLAAGRSNKEIAAALVISDKTVQRHLANIFTKLELKSRTAAAAYAFEHGLAH